MHIHTLEFGSLLSYTPRGSSDKIRSARDVTLAIKTDHILDQPPMLPSEWIARTVKQFLPSLPYASFLTSQPILVPVPSSSLMKEDTLWVPDRIAKSLVANGIGREVAACLSRATAVPKSATSDAPDRPKPLRHFETLAIQESISQPPDEILLVDDIVTRGATMWGAANRLAEAYPEALIRGFAAVRTISNPYEFEELYRPVKGTIEFREDLQDTLRRP